MLLGVFPLPGVRRERGLWERGHRCCQPWAIAEGRGCRHSMSPGPSVPLPSPSTSLPSLGVALPPFPWLHHEKKGPFPSPRPHTRCRSQDVRDLLGRGQYPREGRGCVGVLLPFSIINPSGNRMFLGRGRRQTQHRISLPLCPWDLISNPLSPPASRAGRQRCQLRQL